MKVIVAKLNFLNFSFLIYDDMAIIPSAQFCQIYFHGQHINIISWFLTMLKL